MTFTMRATLGTPRPAGSPDFFQTPPEYVSWLLDVETFDGIILEPAAGDGAIVRVLQAHGHDVIWFDKFRGVTRRDFMDWKSTVPNIITNPPYGRGRPEAFITRALAVSTRKVAMLLRLTFLEGQKRRPKFENEWPLKTVYILTKRWNFATNDWGGATAYAWYVFDKSWEPNNTQIRWL
jgi:hypothetical protein